MGVIDGCRPHRSMCGKDLRISMAWALTSCVVSPKTLGQEADIPASMFVIK
jgi:hypothetical protein